MGCITGCARAIITNVICLLMLAASVGMICIIAVKLTNYNVSLGTADIGNNEHIQASVKHKCLLTTDDNYDVCKFGYIVNAISLAATMYLMITACWTCICWTFIGEWLDWVVTTVATVFWVAISINFTKRVHETDSTIPEQEKFRHLVVVISWGLALKFGILCIISHIRVLTTCCGCCGGGAARRPKQGHHKIKNDEDVEGAKHHVGHAAQAMNHQYAPMNH